MNLSHFFIDRPIFASVISCLILLGGAVMYFMLPVEQFPNIVPPTVNIMASYPGASAETVVDTVATPIEKQVNGVDNMLYMSTTCTSDGSLKITVTFEVGTDPDMATVLVQNRVNVALPQLPEEVTRQGVTVKKQATNMIAALTFYNPQDMKDYKAGKRMTKEEMDAETFILQTSLTSTSKTNFPARRESAMCRYSARWISVCGFGSIPKSLRHEISPSMKLRRHCGLKMYRLLRDESVNHLLPSARNTTLL